MTIGRIVGARAVDAALSDSEPSSPAETSSAADGEDGAGSWWSWTPWASAERQLNRTRETILTGYLASLGIVAALIVSATVVFTRWGPELVTSLTTLLATVGRIALTPFALGLRALERVVGRIL